MTTPIVSATEASRQLYDFFFNGGSTINYRDIRYLEDNLTVIDFFLKQNVTDHGLIEPRTFSWLVKPLSTLDFALKVRL